MCLEIPRPSEDLLRIQEKLMSIGKKHGLEVERDKAGNVRLRKKPSKGCENSIPVVIQSHMDVVTTKSADIKHDFHKDPVNPYIEGNYLKAKGTTLGADDGIGIAASLALLISETSLVHGPLEAVFTSDEETTMAGAEFMDKEPFLQANTLINVDSEEEHSICVGCAGGFEKKTYITCQKKPNRKEARKRIYRNSYRN